MRCKSSFLYALPAEVAAWMVNKMWVMGTKRVHTKILGRIYQIGVPLPNDHAVCCFVLQNISVTALQNFHNQFEGEPPPGRFALSYYYKSGDLLFIATVFFAEPGAGAAVPGSIVILSAIFCLKIASVKADAVTF